MLEQVVRLESTYKVTDLTPSLRCERDLPLKFLSTFCLNLEATFFIVRVEIRHLYTVYIPAN